MSLCCHVSCVMCHVSCVMCHVSCVMCHVSCVMCHVSRCQVSGVWCHGVVSCHGIDTVSCCMKFTLDIFKSENLLWCDVVVYVLWWCDVVGPPTLSPP